MSFRVYLPAAAAAAAVAIAIPVAASSQGGPQTINLTEHNKGSTFNYIDNPPRNPHKKRPVFSPGDEFVFTNPVTDSAGARDGELRAKCTTLRKAPASDKGFNQSHPVCAGALVLRDGTIFLNVAEGGNNVSGAVAGGTGAYANARGTFQTTNTKSGSNDVVTLEP